jgi:hypothetical protein
MYGEKEWMMDQVQAEGLFLVDSLGRTVYRNAAGRRIESSIDLTAFRGTEIPGRPGFVLIRVPVNDRERYLEHLIESTDCGLALYAVDTASGDSQCVVKSNRYTELMKISAAELEEEGMRALGRRVALCDREQLDPMVEQALMDRTSIATPFRVVHEGQQFWRFCNGNFTSGHAENQVFLTSEIRDFTEQVKERRIAEQALATSASLACLMNELFEVQFYVDETLRIVSGSHSVKLMEFFGGKVPNSLHDVVADIESSNRLVKYFATRPVLCRETLHDPQTPSLITVLFRLEGQVQVFAASAFLDSQQPVRKVSSNFSMIQTIVGGNAPVAREEEERVARRFLVALRRTVNTPNSGEHAASKAREVHSTTAPSDTDILAVVALVFGRALRGLIMDSLSAVCNQHSGDSNACSRSHPLVPPVGFISPGFAPRNVTWCAEELLLVLPPETQPLVAKVASSNDFSEALAVLGPWVDTHEPSPAATANLSRAMLAAHLLMGIAGSQPRESDRLHALHKLNKLIESLVWSLTNHPRQVLYSIALQVQLEFATLVTREACNSPTLYDIDPTRAWLRSIVVNALSAPLSAAHPVPLQPIMPAVFFLTILFADFCFKTRREDNARELLLSSIEEMESFRLDSCPELSSVRQLTAIASHNLAVEALNRTDMIGAFNHVFRLQRERQILPPACRKLLQWAVSLSGGL